MLSSKPKSQATLDCTITELLRHELIHYYDETLFNKITAACVSLQESHGTPLIFEPSPHGFDSQKNRLISELRAYFFSGMIKFHHPNFSDDEIIDKIVSEAVKSIQPVKFSSQRTDFTNEGEMQDFARAKLVESCENDHYLIKDLIDFCGFDHVL